MLVVESDRELAVMLPAILADEGHAAEVVPDRAAALDALGARSFDACLCDGFGPWATEATDRDLADLAAMQARAPVVLCTAHGWAARLGPGALGVSGVVAKPFGLDDLLAALDRVAR